MMEAFDEQWLTTMAAGAPSLPVDVSVVITVALSSGRGADRVTTWRVEGGTVTAMPGAPDGDADLAFTVSPQDAVEIVTGGLDPACRRPQGRLKASGDMALLLRLLALSSSEQFTDWRAAAPSLVGG